MRQTPLANPFKFRINIRPVKIAYFVMKDSPSLLLNLVRLTCTQWGGIRHLIIPLETDLSIPSFYIPFLQLHEPDQYVAYIDFKTYSDSEVINSLQNQLHEILPHRHPIIQRGVTFEKYDSTAHTLGMLSDSVAKSSHLSMPHLEETENELLSTILFGQIYPGQEQDYHNFITTTVQTIELGDASFWENQMEIEPFYSVLNLTSYHIFAYRVEGGWLDSFDYFDLIFADSIEDYSLFWNMRTLRECLRFSGQREALRRTICVPMEILNRPESLNILFALIKQKLFKPGRKANLDIRLYCLDQEVREKVKSVLSICPLVTPFAEETITGNDLFSRKSREIHEAIEDRSLTYLFSNISMPGRYLETIAWSLPIIANLNYRENEIRFEPPEQYYNRYGGAVAVDFECDIWNRYPRTYSVASYIDPNCWFSKYGVSMVMASLSSSPTFIHFKLPDEQEAVKLFFQENGYTSNITKVTQYSNALIDLVNGLQGVKIFASKTCYLLLDKLTVKSTKKVAQRIVKELKLPEFRAEEISQVFHNLELPEELKGIPRTFSELLSEQPGGLSKNEQKKDLFDLLEKLTQSQILKRGFYLACPVCGNAEWHPLNSINEHLICPGCTSQFALPIRDGQEEMRWRYRLNTTVNRAMDQDVLVGLLAVYHLTKEQQIGGFQFGIQLDQNGSTLGEFDFVYIANNKVHAGECKAGTRLTEKDFELAQLAAKLKMTTFCFATVRQFDSETLEKIEEIQKIFQEEGKSIQIRILSGVDLLGDALEPLLNRNK